MVFNSRLEHRSLVSYLFFILVVIASTFPGYQFYFYFKFALLIFSLFIVLATGSFVKLKKNKYILSYLMYSIFLILNIEELDSFSIRIIFNSVLIITACYASLSLAFSRKHLRHGLTISLVFFVYAYLFNVNVIDGKPQVHAQTIGILVLLFALYYENSRFRLFLIALPFVFFSNVRSVLLGLISIIPFGMNVKSELRLWLLFTVSLAGCGAVFASLFYYLSEYSFYFGERATGSFSWRLYHWQEVFAGFTTDNWIFGKGLGYSWRMTLGLSNFYADGSTYIAAHSNYVKIIAETGLIGLAVFLILMGYLFSQSNGVVKSLIAFYLCYGFYDEGVWLFSLIWFFILVYNGRRVHDFNNNNH